MLKLILKQTNWSILGAIFSFSIGFFLKVYLLNIVQLESWGKYVTAQTFATACDTIIAIGIPFALIKFIPSFLPENKERAQRMASLAIKYGFFSGIIALCIVYLFKDNINSYIYSEINDSDFSWMLVIMCIHIPISLLLGFITALYRSVLKIKEIVIYGTIISVSIRSLATFLVFHFTQTKDITYFIIIEVITQFLVLSLLMYLFHTREFSIFSRSRSSEFIRDKEITQYTRRLFFHSFVAFLAGYFLRIIISITLSPEDIGAYNILITLTGLTTFLLIHLNKVFAPAISKLYHEGKISDLNTLYKQTTFIINFFTIPIAILIAIFSDEILSFYTEDLVIYKPFLLLMLMGGIASTIAGSSGTLMIMAGLERENLILQIIKAILVVGLSVWLIFFREGGLLEIVLLHVMLMFLLNISQLIFIKKYIHIHPFSRKLIKLFFVSFPCILMAYWIEISDYNFTISHYLLIPFLLYLIYFSFFYNSIKNTFKEIT